MLNMQKHINPSLHQAQTCEALRRCKQYFGQKHGTTTPKEKQPQTDREMRLNFSTIVAHFLASIGLKVR